MIALYIPCILIVYVSPSVYVGKTGCTGSMFRLSQDSPWCICDISGYVTGPALIVSDKTP